MCSAAWEGAGSFDFVFIDTPGIDSPGTRAVIALSDFCLVPCRPTPADLRSVSPTLAAIHRLEKDFAFVLTQTPPKGFPVRQTRPRALRCSACWPTLPISRALIIRMQSEQGRA